MNWEQVYLDARRNPGRDTLHFSAKNKCTLPEGKGSDRLIVFAVDLHMYASGINPVSYHPAGCYALKDNSISLSCMPIAYNMDTGTIMFSTAFKYMGGPKMSSSCEISQFHDRWPKITEERPSSGSVRSNVRLSI